MRILFHRYGSICEPDILSVFRALGIEVEEEEEEITCKNIPAKERVRLLSDRLFNASFDFVFSINYFPYISEVCLRFGIPYVCFSVDCPVLELFSDTLGNPCNRIFLFDYEQYTRFVKRNPEHIFYLPLATNTARWDSVLSSLTAQDREKYSCELSFVGSLYLEKSPLSGNGLSRLSKQIQGYVDGLMEAQLKVYGYNFLEEVTTPALIAELKEAFPDYPSLPDAFKEEDIDRYVAANHYLGMRAAELERVRTLRMLSERHSVTLYTRSLPASSGSRLCGNGVSGDPACGGTASPLFCGRQNFPLPRVDIREGISTLTQMPKVFRLSKINLNITIRPIQTGLSLRVFDVLGCGGFLLTNYQPELSEYFEIGRDLDCYESMEDLESKVSFYLAHEDLRKEIAHNGYEKVKAGHTWAHRISQMFHILFHDPEQ